MQDILDYSMLKCQATWLYLEPIFSSEDIIAQMPEEGRKFAIVDRYWKDIIAEAVRHTHTPEMTVCACLYVCGDFLILTNTLYVCVQMKDTRVLVATDQANMLGRLEEANVFLEDIQRGLNTYLEKKRLFFPR